MNIPKDYKAFVATREVLTDAAINATFNARRGGDKPSLNVIVSFLRAGMNNPIDSDVTMDTRERLIAIKNEIAAAQTFLGDIDAALDTHLEALQED